MKPRLETPDRAELQGHEIEKQRAVGFSCKADQLAARLGRGRVEDVLQVGRLTTQTRAVVDDLAVDFSGSVINKGHSGMPLAEKTVDVFVGDSGEGRIEIVIVSGSNLLEQLGKLMRNLLAAEFY